MPDTALRTAGAPLSDWNDGFAVVLTCEEMDRFHHNAVFVEELTAAFAELGVPLRALDYRRQVRAVSEALRDPGCRFFLCFNGFGSEVSIPVGAPGHLASVFEVHRKPLFDLMHDCPALEPMAHQVASRGDARCVLLTDYGYVQEAKELGFPDVRFVPSITFPRSLPRRERSMADRPIELLLPMGLVPTDLLKSRHEWDFGLAPPGGKRRWQDWDSGYRGRVYRDIFEAVTERCIDQLRLDPRAETRAACREAGVAFDVNHADSRFLLTTILDCVKFERRRNTLKALKGFPVTVVADRMIEDEFPDARFTFAPARSFRDLLGMMADARAVLCPLPHMTGFHERALGAFTAGAAVLAAPNDVLETNFLHGRDMLIYRNPEELADLLADLLPDADRVEEIGRCGQSEALARFAPLRLAETVLSLWRLRAAD